MTESKDALTANVVLYRKYRPQAFDELIGQEPIVQTLTNSIESGSISHAYLFCGPRGSGKTTIARILAKAINCQGKGKKKPCDGCNACLEISAGKSLDVIEIDAASHTGVEDVRELIDGLKFPPVALAYKIFIIDECHQLSKSASNALLKTLEEPPSHAIFILATTEVHKMLPTIISRCQRFDFKRLHVPQIVEKLQLITKKEGVEFEAAGLSLIALNARGSFRDAESLLDKCLSFTGTKQAVTAQKIKELLGIVEVGQISKFVGHLIQKNTKDAIAFINALLDEGVDLGEFAKTLVFYLRQMLLVKIDAVFNEEHSDLSKEELIILKEQAGKLSEKDVQQWLQLFMEAEQKLKYAAILQLPLEMAVVDITWKIS